MATCYRHPSRETAVSCSNCGRAICPDCMTPTQVGMRCPECASQRTRGVRMRDVAAVPRVTYALIALNVAAFLTEKGQFTINGSGIYGTVVNEGVLYRAGISEGHQYYRLVSSAFLHVDLLHIGFNMYLLYLLGMMLEPAIGSVRFAAIYFTSLLCGSCGALVATAAPSLGASGAVFGLMGAAAGGSCARGGASRDALRHRVPDRVQPAVQLHRAQHLRRRSHRRLDRRRAGGPLLPPHRRPPLARPGARCLPCAVRWSAPGRGLAFAAPLGPNRCARIV